jgi:hypothetical protein
LNDFLPFQEKICLQLSDWLIQRGEQRRWMELTENIDFNEDVDPSLYLCPHADLPGGAISPAQQQQECSASTLMQDGYQREEGNSVFYAKSCSQQPSTSTATPRFCLNHKIPIFLNIFYILYSYKLLTFKNGIFFVSRRKF